MTPLKAGPRDRSDDSERNLVDRVRSEFVEMQGFSPTFSQAARLFHLSERECSGVLAALVSEGFLDESADGRYRLRRHG
jgi:hypothetical protein